MTLPQIGTLDLDMRLRCQAHDLGFWQGSTHLSLFGESVLTDLIERPVSIVHATAVAFWIAGLLLIVADLFAAWRTSDLGLFVAGVGGVLTIRGYLCHLHDREVRAFELGRDVAGLRSVK